MDAERYRDTERRLWRSVGVTPSERMITLAHTGTTVRVQEVGDGPPVLFVHGASNSGASWAQMAARMPGFRCILLDRPGCGLSDPLPTPFPDVEALSRFADPFLVDVLDGMGVTQAHLVATSFGSYFALRAAAAHPDRIGRLVGLGWTAGTRNGRLPAVMRLAVVPGLGRALAALPPTEKGVRMMLAQVGLRQALDAGRVPQEVIDTFLSLQRDTDTMVNELKAGPRMMRPLKGMDKDMVLSPELLARVRSPVYFLWGEEDLFGGADIAREFVAQLPNAELEIVPGAGHAVWVDDPDHAAETASRFLEAGLGPDPLG